MAWKKSSRLSAGLPEQMTSMRAVSVRTRKQWAAPTGDEGERSRCRQDDLSIHLELDLSLEDVEGLILVGLDVHRRVGRGGDEVLGEAVGAGRLGHRRLRRHQGVEEPCRGAGVWFADE